MVVFLLFLSLCPLLGWSCSCFRFPGRQETLKDGICDNDNVYSGVVLSATCTCLLEAQNETFDCRTFSYFENNDTYSEEVVRRVTGNVSRDFGEVIKTCDKADSILAPKNNLTTGEEPPVTTTDEGTPLVCPSNDKETDYGIGSVCVYEVKVTEVFVGNFNKDEIVTSVGPDTQTSCSQELGRILQLKEEYLVGVGGACSYFNEWRPLANYSSSDLDTLRELGKMKNPETCGSSMLSPMTALVMAILLISML